jgi:hypothetical protein
MGKTINFIKKLAKLFGEKMTFLQLFLIYVLNNQWCSWQEAMHPIQ